MLSRTTKLVQRVLLLEYGLPPEEARRVEEELFLWFRRLCRRPGAPQTLQGSRVQLISMACKIAHVYWIGRLGGVEPRDERVKRCMSLGPEIIAIEVEKEAEKTDGRAK